MNLSSFPFPSVQSLLAMGIALGAAQLRAEPFVPQDDQQVLEKLRAVPVDSVTRELRALRARLSADPGNLEIAGQLARRCIEQSRAEGDPRYLGHAQAALAPWWSCPQPPVEALILRATIEQSQHDFPKALADLDLALERAPNSAQAWLTRATVLTVLGRFGQAREACVHLARLAPRFVAITAAANVASLNGGAERSCCLLRQTLESDSSASSPEKLWALTLLAETSARLDHTAEAESEFKRALGLGERDAYVLGAFADFLLDQGKPSPAVALLKDESRVDALLLRLALAEAALAPAPASLGPHIRALQARFEASRLRGDTVHRREQARFTLSLLHEPRQALRLAQANWDVQREPADARILLESALAARDSAAAAPVLEFVQTNKLEDMHLTKLLAQMNSLRPR